MSTTTNSTTPRQQIIATLSYRVAQRNYEAWRNAIGDPTTESVTYDYCAKTEGVTYNPRPVDLDTLREMIDGFADLDARPKVYRYYMAASERALDRLEKAIMSAADQRFARMQDTYDYAQHMARIVPAHQPTETPAPGIVNQEPPTMPQDDPPTTLTASSTDLALLEHADDLHPALAYIASLGSKRSRQVMLDDLAMVAAIIKGIERHSISADERRGLVFDIAWHELNNASMNLLRTTLADLYSHNTANRMLAAVRGVLKFCWRQGHISAEQLARAVDIQPVKGESLLTGRSIDPGEIAQLFTTCAEDATAAGARDAALFACADAGLRRAEIAALNLDSYDPQAARLKVHGKGNKDRLVPLNTGQRQALEDWLTVRGTEPGALLWPVNKGGNMTPRRMTPQALYNAMKKRGQEAKVNDFTPHDFRRTFAGDLLDAGADIATVQRMMGHADVKTTARYDRRPERAKDRAASLRHTPYKGRKQTPLPEK